MVKAKKIPTTRSSASKLLLALGMIVLINVLSQQLFFRVDLTKEKRYTLSASSERLASKLNDVLYIKVYLEGEFPAGFKRLRNSTRELLDEYRIVSDGKIEYEFIDPFEGKTTEQINEIVQQLGEKGLYPTNVQIKQDDEMSQKLIVPGATFAYKGKEYPLNLLKNQFGADPEQTINQSLELLEYQISNVLRKCTIEEKKKIAFLTGNGELQGKEVADFARELAEYYELGRINLHDFPVEKLTEFDGMIIAKPDSFFTEYDKFKIDQYIMHGGKVIWLIDALFANMDSTRNSAGEFMTYNYDLNLDDMLFRYGARINPVLVQDLQSNYIPILNNFPGAPAQTKMLPWLFYPVMGSSSNHPIVKNLDYVWGQFTNTI
ncbi:MAG TPA: Gldg family protein, partial [Bacteroidia bacterium]|nr:Gldg family protein [Bacteroidia bacterium]